MGWKCDKCKKSYKFIHDGNPKNPRLAQMMNGKFICSRCYEIESEKIKNKKKFGRVSIDESQFLFDNMQGVIL